MLRNKRKILKVQLYVDWEATQLTHLKVGGVLSSEVFLSISS